MRGGLVCNSMFLLSWGCVELENLWLICGFADVLGWMFLELFGRGGVFKDPTTPSTQEPRAEMPKLRVLHCTAI